MFGNRMKNCSVFASLISPSKMILFEKKYQTFDTSKFVKNTPLRVVFSTLFSVFHLVMKHCFSCLIYYFTIWKVFLGYFLQIHHMIFTVLIDCVNILLSYSPRMTILKVAEHSFGSFWVQVICQIMAGERLQLSSRNLASEKYNGERFWLTGKIWRFRSFHGNMNDWIQP